MIVPTTESPPTYSLRDDIRTMVLARFARERPFEEMEIQTQALHYFLRHIEQGSTAEHHDSDEERCLYHLGELFELIRERREWPTLANYVAIFRAIPLRHERHRRWVSFYEGTVAIRTRHYDMGEAIMRALLDSNDLDDTLRIYVLDALGILYHYQARYDRALDFYQQVYALARSSDTPLYQGIALMNMGMIYNELGFYDHALELSTQSLNHFRALHRSYREVHVLYEIGNTALHLGRWLVAQNHFSAAIAISESLQSQVYLTDLYWSQGFLHHILGDETQSAAAYQRALALAQAPERPNLTAMMDVWLYFGLLQQTQERWGEALECYDQAMALAGQLRNQHSLILINYRRGEIYRRLGQEMMAIAAYRTAIEDIEALRGATETEEIKIGLLSTTQQVYEAMILLCLDQGRHGDAFEYVERARSRAFLDVLVHKSPELYATFDQPVAILAEVQAQLPTDALLIEYFTTGVLPRGEHLINKLPPENVRLRAHLILPPQVVIFAITRSSCMAYRVTLDPNTLRPPPDDPAPARRLLRDRVLTHLYNHLIGPVEHLLREYRQVFLIPHGPLHYVPFMALRSASGSYVLDAAGPALALAPSATILLRNCLNREPSPANQFLALGYNDQGADYLRYAEAEAQHVARLMDGQAWIGAATKSDRLQAIAGQVGWLHIAGHAIYHPHDPLASELRLGEGDSLNARSIIGTLDLRANLVTLSACTSGLSHVVPGDELLGLQRAFLYAGAPTVVCTLWEAADFVALLVMERFYTDLRNGAPAAVALRDAQVALRTMTGRDLAATIARWQADDPGYAAALQPPPIAPEDYDRAIFADPLYWAPFMLIGRP